MGFLRSKTNSPSAVPQFTGLQIQTSSNAVPITLLWGTKKVSPNVIWTGGFYSVPQNQPQGGKGGGGQRVAGYEYFSDFAMGVCEGPVAGFGRIWVGQSIFGDFWGTGITFARYGEPTQPPWPYLAPYGQQSIGYNGLAYIAANNYDLGSSPVLPLFSLEVFGPLNNSALLNGFDADPALVVQDFLTNSQYGVGFPAASIDATTLLGLSGPTYQAYCRALSLAFSPALINQEAANSILARWLQLTNTAAVWSGGKLKFIPYGDTSATGGGVTFTPNVAPLYNLADDDFIHEDGKDPLEVVRSDPYASFNWQRLNASQRWNNYDAVPVDVFDQNAIELYGLRVAPEITGSEFCDPYIAQTAAQLILQRGLYIRNAYHFKLSFEYCLLEPMDLVTVTDAGLGLANVAVRITAIEEDDAGLLSVTAEEFPGGIATAVQYPIQTKNPNSTNQAVVPARVNPPVLYEPPAALTGGVAQVAAAVSGGIAPVYKLMETSATGGHSTSQAYTSSLALGASLSFSIYVQAAERTACRLNFFNGVVKIGCDFNLAAGTAATPDGGIASVNIAAVAAGPPIWYQLSITGLMAAAGTPTVYVLIENPLGISSYTGVSGDGFYFWGQQLSWSDPAAGKSQDPSFLPAFLTVTNASLATSGIATPEGAVGTADPNWGGAFVWISTDGTTYGKVGQVSAPARQGVLTAPLPAPPGANPDNTNTLSVSLIESGGVLANATTADAQNGVTLCLVDNELLAYATAALTGPNAYNLTYLYRGLYGTAAAAHSSGALFARVDSAVFQYPLPAAFIGVPLFLKFQSFNIFGRAIEDLSECAVYPYTPSGVGSPVGPVTKSLKLGQNQDFRLVTVAVTETDQWGVVTDGVLLASIDLGTGIL
jgi:hypothetical protein